MGNNICTPREAKTASLMNLDTILSFSMETSLFFFGFALSTLLYQNASIPHCLQIPCITIWFLILFRIGLSYQRDIRRIDTGDWHWVETMLFALGATGFFAGLYIDLS